MKRTRVSPLIVAMCAAALAPAGPAAHATAPAPQTAGPAGAPGAAAPAAQPASSQTPTAPGQSGGPGQSGSLPGAPSGQTNTPAKTSTPPQSSPPTPPQTNTQPASTPNPATQTPTNLPPPNQQPAKQSPAANSPDSSANPTTVPLSSPANPAGTPAAPQPSQALSPGQINSPGITLLPNGTAAQPANPSIPQSNALTSAANPGAPTQSGPAITLEEALKRAQANEPAFVAAVAASKTAALDHSIARAALLPSVIYHNQYLYTQGTRLSNDRGQRAVSPLGPGVPTFIANNAVHEYVSQASVNETLGLVQYTALSRATAAAALAQAELEVSRRGLTSTVVNLFYSSTTAGSKLAIQQRALNEAASFVTQTQQREAAREAAHADVLKAQLTLQQRQRDLADAQLAIEKARIDLGVLLFADPRSPYTVTLPAPRPLPSRAEVATAANTNNPELKSALATFRARSLDIAAAQAAYLPALALNYSYGIDSTQFAVKGRESAPGLNDNLRNLGYSASATLDIPIFDWFATQNKIRQARILRDAAKTTVSAAQRTLIAQLEEFYNEATLAEQQLQSLELSVNTARESLRLTRLRYTAGESTVLEVVDAQNTLTAAELALTDGSVRYQLALANLQLLTGTI